MPSFSASSPGKIILFGEHSVVYGRPAIAVPVLQVRAKAIVSAEPRGIPGRVMLRAPDIGLEACLADLPEEHPLAAVVLKAASAMQLSHIPACTIAVSSTIPIAGGMGSGAAVSVAILRAFSACMGHPLRDEQVSQLAYEVEIIHHGTPSGIDNTVITYAKPVYYVRGKTLEVLSVRQPFTLLIADTGIASPTRSVVSDVHQGWEKAPEKFEQLFDRIGLIASAARTAIETGSNEQIGPLMDENHDLLREMGASSPELDILVTTARSSGASGAKLSGAGRGGNIIALIQPEKADQVARALTDAGAVSTIVTEVHTR